MQRNEAEQEMVCDFLIEAWEQLEMLDREFVSLEENPQTAQARVNNIFRVMHTLKGGAGFLSLELLESLAHYAETLLARMRAGELGPERERIDILLRTADALKAILRNLERTGGDEGPPIYADLLVELKRAGEVPAQNGAAKLAAPPPPPPEEEEEDIAVEPEVDSAREEQRREMEEYQAQLLAALEEPAPAPKAASTAPESATEAPESHPEEGAPSGGVAESRIRVHVDLLDKLMNLVGELVLSRNQILQVAGSFESSALASACQRINLVTGELQEQIMQTRMQPISTLLNRFPRIIRDLASQTGKEVRFSSDGQDTGLDRTILEAIRDPLTHIVRNSIDHGLEKPEDRVRLGKPARGLIHVRAYHEGGQVTIEVHDDGKGIDLERVRRKAVEQRLVEEAEAQRMSERDALQLLFRPGFSTVDKVTHLSGRGVGMDVVRSSVERIGGTVDLVTHKGRGTSVKLRIPLTLAIIPALIVTTGSERYAIPQVSLQELVRLEGQEVKRSIERLYGSEVYRLRGELLPLLRLRSVLGLPPNPQEDILNIVVVSADGSSFGLVVDGVCDTQEIVVKPLSQDLKQLQIYAGATIMGDGRVSLIMDVAGLARNCRLERDAARAAQEERREGRDTRSTQSLLLFTLGGDEQFAIPITLLSRLEEFPASSVERLGHRSVVQYRDRLLPLMDLAEQLGRPGPEPSECLQVLVFSNGERQLGLVVGQIQDVVELNFQVDSLQGSHGVMGTAIIAGRATTIVDLHGLLLSAEPEWLEMSPAKETAPVNLRVLVADDSHFHSAVTSSYLQTAGHHVSLARELQGIVDRVQRESFDALIVEMGMRQAAELVSTLARSGSNFRGKLLVTCQRAQLDFDSAEGVTPIVPYSRDTLLAALGQNELGGVA